MVSTKEGYMARISPCRFEELARYLDAKQRETEEGQGRPVPQEDAPAEAVDHPSHYRKDSGYEAIDVIEAWGLGFSLGNAVKYICRAGLKQDALEDLEKARWYLDHEIERRRRL